MILYVTCGNFSNDTYETSLRMLSAHPLLIYYARQHMCDGILSWMSEI